MKNVKYIAAAALLLANSAHAQDARKQTPVQKELTTSASGKQKDGKQVFNFVEVMPSTTFSMGKYLSENIHYPDSAIAHNIEGRVIVRFVVNEDGSISDCEVVRGIDPDCDAEALRVVSKMPKWKPGMQNGKKVKVYFTQPIVFKLTD